MSVILKKDAWKIKDPITGEYRDSGIFSTGLPEEAERVVAEAREDINEIAQAVASMAQLGTDTTLSIPGMAADAKTVGDKFDNIERIVSSYARNAIDYGIRNDNSGNQAPAINNLINLCDEGDNIYLPNGIYRITEPIIINKPITFICDGQIRSVMSSINYSIIISEARVNLKFRTLSTFNANSGGIKIYSDQKTINLISIDFGTIGIFDESSLDGISVIADEYSVYDVHISGKRISGNENINGISFTKISQTSSIGEILIKDVLITHCNYGIYSADNNLLFGTGNVNSIMTVNCHLENNNKGFYYKNNRSPTIINCRIAEQQKNDIFTFEGFVYNGTYIGRTPVRLNKIKFINPKKVSEYTGFDSYTFGFFINGPVYFSSNDPEPKTFAFIDGGKVYTNPIELTETDLSN